VFNTSYRVLWLTLSLVSCIAGAVSIKFGMALGSSDIPRARHLLAVGGTMGVRLIITMARLPCKQHDGCVTRKRARAGDCKQAIMLAIVSSVMFQIPDKLGALFSDDFQARVGPSWHARSVYLIVSVGIIQVCDSAPVYSLTTSSRPVIEYVHGAQVTALFVEIRLPLLCTIVMMNLAVCQERMLITLGKTRPVLYLGFVASWLGQVPMVLLLMRFWKADLMGLYSGVATGYTMLVAMYAIVLYRVDLHRAAELAGERSELAAVKMKVVDWNSSSQVRAGCVVKRLFAGAPLQQEVDGSCQDSCGPGDEGDAHTHI
jgi:hypothetical protein